VWLLRELAHLLAAVAHAGQERRGDGGANGGLLGPATQPTRDC
jgi:hypothetical protein